MGRSLLLPMGTMLGLWDTATAAPKGTLIGNTNDVIDIVVILRIGKTLASSSADGTVLVWKITNFVEF